MDMNRYQKDAMTTAVYPGRKTLQGLIYTTLGLAGEAGELANKVKKILRDSGGVLTDDVKLAIKRELEDCQWYVAATADELGFLLSDVARDNLWNLKNRRLKKMIQGSGDER